jgi:Tol biopolymer transport system component
MSRILRTLTVAIVLAGAIAPVATGFAGRDGRIVYAYSGQDLAANTNIQQLLSVRPDGSAQQTIGSCTTDAMTGHANCSGAVGVDPAISANGRMLAFVRDGQIWISTIDGSGAHAITPANPSQLPIGDPAWEPDGHHLAFTDNGNVDVVRPDGEFLHTVVRFGRRPAWSPDGRTMVFVHDGPCGVRAATSCPRELDLTNIAGTYVRALIRGAYDAPTWSPHGSRLAFVHFRSPTKAGFVLRPTVETVASNGRGPHRIIETMSAATPNVPLAAKQPDLAWAPDGRTIAIQEADARISIVGASGGHRRQIASPRGLYDNLIEGIDWARQ